MVEKPPKARLRAWLQDWNPASIQNQAVRDKRSLSYLLALSYDQDALIAWRAVEAYGLAASKVAAADAEFVRNQLRRLHWLLSDESGGVGWRAPELMGEILYRCPEQFGEYIPILVSLIDMEEQDAARFRAGYLWATGRVAAVLSSALQGSITYILPCLHDNSPQIRGLAAWSIGRVAPAVARHDLTQLLEDQHTLVIYEHQELKLVSVAVLAEQALRTGKRNP